MLTLLTEGAVRRLSCVAGPLPRGVVTLTAKASEGVRGALSAGLARGEGCGWRILVWPDLDGNRNVRWVAAS